MTQFHAMFRRLLHRNIPQLSDRDIDLYDSLVALRHNLVQEKHIIGRREPQVDLRAKSQTQEPEPPSDYDLDIAETTQRAQAIFAPYAKEYDACVRLWMARRDLLYHQGNFLQIPLDGSRLKKLLAAIMTYRRTQLQTFPVLAKNRISFYFKSLSFGRAFVVVISTILALVCWYQLTFNK